jgi:hypothetical protein
MGELVDDVEHTELAAIMAALLDKVVRPDVVGALGSEPDAPSDYRVERPAGVEQSAVEQVKEIAAARLSLKPTLGGVVARELLGPTSDLEVTKRTMDRAGRDFEAACSAVQAMFDARQIARRADQLSPLVLAHLATHAQQLARRAAATKPANH